MYSRLLVSICLIGALAGCGGSDGSKSASGSTAPVSTTKTGTTTIETGTPTTPTDHAGRYVKVTVPKTFKFSEAKVQKHYQQATDRLGRKGDPRARVIAVLGTATNNFKRLYGSVPAGVLIRYDDPAGVSLKLRVNAAGRLVPAS